MSVGMIQYSPTHACFGPAMQPCVGSSGTTASDQPLPSPRSTIGLPW
jgi:hypothetical protein